MKRCMAVLLSALCVLLAGGCNDLPDIANILPETNKTTPTDVPQEELVFALPYSHDDTLNPYAATTEVNLQLAHLLYDSLTVIADGYMPQLSLAEEIEFTDATHLTATLREGAVFSDGTAVTVEDVVRSYKEARTSAHYATLLSNVTAAKGNSKQRQITFTLATADIHAWGCLTFPIIKGSTLTTEAAAAPVGGGLYALSTESDTPALVKNPHHPTAVQFEQVALRHLPGMSSRYYALASGQIAYCFDDLSEGETPHVTGAVRPVAMNTMVLVGINSAHPQLEIPAVRQALSLMLDRAAMAAVYGEHATASASPLPTAWQPMTDCSAPTAEQDTDTATALLTQAAYPLKGKNKPTLRLIYNAEREDRAAVAELFRVQAEAVGVQITLLPMGETEYRQALLDGEYELYLGEYRFGADMSLRGLLLGGEASYGVAADSAAVTAYIAYLGGQSDLQTFLDTFGTDAPFISLCYRGGLAAYDRRLTTVTPTGYDPYHGIAGWQ